MNGKKAVISAVAGLALLASVTGAAVAAPVAQTPDGQAAQQEWRGQGMGNRANAECRPGPGAGLGLGAAQNPMAAPAAAADVLGLSVDEITDARLAGKSLADLAAEQGISEEDLVAGILETRKAALQAKVDEGAITQEQADSALARMETRISESLDRTEMGPNRPEDAPRLGLAWGRGGNGNQLGPQDGTGTGPMGRGFGSGGRS